MKKLFIYLLPLMAVACDTEVEKIQTPTDAKPIVLKENLQKRIGQDNQFAFELLRQTIAANKTENATVSPLSVSLALGMTLNGAVGETKTEMEKALHLSGLTTSEMNEYYKVLQSTLPGIDPLTKVGIANSIWYDKDFQVKSAFLQTNVTYFNAYTKALDFKASWAKDTINNWSSLKTNKLIPSIVDEIPPEAVMYLVNAVYFKGVWRLKFDKKLTHRDTFYGSKNNTTANFMKQQNKFHYFADETAQYVDLEYGNKAFSMTAILPNEGKTTDDVLRNLNTNKWENIIKAFASKDLLLYFPRFKSENKFALNQPLITMGMPLAFTDLADFSNIANARLFISKVMHKTYIAVDEEGTEAAAVTSVEVGVTSIPMTHELKFNKPFVYVIREKSTGIILFVGKISTIDLY